MTSSLTPRSSQVYFDEASCSPPTLHPPAPPQMATRPAASIVLAVTCLGDVAAGTTGLYRVTASQPAR